MVSMMTLPAEGPFTPSGTCACRPNTSTTQPACSGRQKEGKMPNILFPRVPQAGDRDWAYALQTILRRLIISVILLALTCVLLGVSIIVVVVRGA